MRFFFIVETKRDRMHEVCVLVFFLFGFFFPCWTAPSADPRLVYVRARARACVCVYLFFFQPQAGPSALCHGARRRPMCTTRRRSRRQTETKQQKKIYVCAMSLSVFFFNLQWNTENKK